MFTEDPKKVTPTFIEKTSIRYGLHELDGKNLRISVGEDVEDGERTSVVVGVDSINGIHYVLGAYKTEEEVEKEGIMTDEEVFKIAGDADTYPVHPFWLKDDITVGSVREAVLRFARAIEAEVKSKQSAQEPKPVEEWEPSFGLQQSFGLAISHGTLWSKCLVSTEDYRWAKERFWDKLKEEVDNHLKGEDE